MNMNKVYYPIPRLPNMPGFTLDLSTHCRTPQRTENRPAQCPSGQSLNLSTNQVFPISQDRTQPKSSGFAPTSGSVWGAPLAQMKYGLISPSSWFGGVNNLKRRYPTTQFASAPDDNSQPKRRSSMMQISHAVDDTASTREANRTGFKPAWCPRICQKPTPTSCAKKSGSIARKGCRNFRRMTVSRSYFPGGTITSLQCQIRNSLKKYGLCVINGFNGEGLGSNIENEVKMLHRSRLCPRGQSVGGWNVAKHVRHDLVTWVDGSEPDYPNLGALCAKLDEVVGTGAGVTQDYDICGSTKAMVARYAGNGAGYHLHVDNPSKDGRCLTCIYYLNKNWDCSTMGGNLQLYAKTSQRTADIQPIFDRMVFFYSDRRNPHKVLPAFEDRYAVTLWYFDRSERAKAIKRMSEQTRFHE